VGFGVYVHVPFCSHRCDYCAFATWTDRGHLWERYAQACRTQAAGLADWSAGPATSVFFGGGTPSLVPAELLTGILASISAAVGLASGAEVTVECNPETVTAAKLAEYSRGGVTRLSFGAQSMVPRVLELLGRRHTTGAVARAVGLAAEAGFGASYNLDLIYGAAGETLGEWERTLEEVLGLDPAPAHLSAYALTVEPGTPLSRQPERYPGDDDQADKYLMADAALSAAGYDWYEISNWSLPGHECRHNRLYWDQGDYAGVGCSAHSHRSGPGGSARRWWNVRTPERYCALVESGASPEAAGEDLATGDRRREALMLALRTRGGVPAGVVPEELFEDGLVETVLAGAPGHDGGSAGALAVPGRARAVLTVRGRLLANEVAVRLRDQL
jgi:oxygen-independent coproporphyrinogen-3 oxidase